VSKSFDREKALKAIIYFVYVPLKIVIMSAAENSDRAWIHSEIYCSVAF